MTQDREEREAREERERREEQDEFDRITRGTSLRQLRDLSEEELIRRYDFLLASPRLHLMLGPDEYLNELTRRETERQSKRLEWLTWALVALTIMITIATVALLVRGE